MGRPLVLVLLAAFGCGTTQSVRNIFRAQAELTAAKTAGAEELAPFELAASAAYLDKAREEQGRSDLTDAARLSKKAYACALVARRLAEARSLDREAKVDPDDFAGEAICRPGPARGGLAPHQEEAARPPPALPEPAPRPGPRPPAAAPALPASAPSPATSPSTPEGQEPSPGGSP